MGGGKRKGRENGVQVHLPMPNSGKKRERSHHIVKHLFQHKNRYYIPEKPFVNTQTSQESEAPPRDLSV